MGQVILELNCGTFIELQQTVNKYFKKETSAMDKNTIKNILKTLGDDFSPNGLNSSSMNYYKDKPVPDFELTDERMSEIQTSIEYIESHRGFWRKVSSYGAKHLVESWTHKISGHRQYICNGSFIVAAVYLGYELVPENGKSPNVNFRPPKIFNA